MRTLSLIVLATKMTEYGFTEGALNHFFSQDDIDVVLRQAGYVSMAANDAVRAIQTSGIASVVEQGEYETTRILRFIIE